MIAVSELEGRDVHFPNFQSPIPKGCDSWGRVMQTTSVASLEKPVEVGTVIDGRVGGVDVVHISQLKEESKLA